VSVFILNRNFLFAFENSAILHSSRLLAILKSDFHREHSRRSAIHTSTAQICPKG